MAETPGHLRTLLDASRNVNTFFEAVPKALQHQEARIARLEAENAELRALLERSVTTLTAVNKKAVECRSGIKQVRDDAALQKTQLQEAFSSNHAQYKALKSSLASARKTLDQTATGAASRVEASVRKEFDAVKLAMNEEKEKFVALLQQADKKHNDNATALLLLQQDVEKIKSAILGENRADINSESRAPVQLNAHTHAHKDTPPDQGPSQSTQGTLAPGSNVQHELPPASQGNAPATRPSTTEPTQAPTAGQSPRSAWLKEYPWLDKPARATGKAPTKMEMELFQNMWQFYGRRGSLKSYTRRCLDEGLTGYEYNPEGRPAQTSSRRNARTPLRETAKAAGTSSTNAAPSASNAGWTEVTAGAMPPRSSTPVSTQTPTVPKPSVQKPSVPDPSVSEPSAVPADASPSPLFVSPFPDRDSSDSMLAQASSSNNKRKRADTGFFDKCEIEIEKNADNLDSERTSVLQHKHAKTSPRKPGESNVPPTSGQSAASSQPATASGQASVPKSENENAGKGLFGFVFH